MGGVCQAMLPQADTGFDQRIRFDGVALHDGTGRLPCASVDEALALVQARPQGRLLVRGSNGSGKSTLLAALKGRLGVDAFYWPTSDKLAFAFAAVRSTDETDDAVEESPVGTGNYAGFSSGERQLRSLAEIASRTRARAYPARRVGRQPRRQKPGQRRATGSRIGRTGRRGRDITPRPGLGR